MSDFIGKTDKRRPRSTTREEENLRWRYATQKPRPMTFDEYEIEYKKLLKEGKIRRSGRIINGR